MVDFSVDDGQEIPDTSRSQRNKNLALGLSLLGLFFFIAWEGILLKSYVSQETCPPSWDQATHLDIALDYWRALRADQWNWKTVLTQPPQLGQPPYPPLYHLALTQAYRSSNPAEAALWVNYAYFALLCLSIFACAYFFRPDYTALLATIAFCASPVIWEYLTTQLVDLPIVAMATATLWAFLISEAFSSWTGSLLFGFLFGLGMMHKWSFFSYFIPVYFSAIGALKFPTRRWKMMTSAFLSLLIFGPWYFYHFPILLTRLLQTSSGAAIPLWNGGIVAYLFSALDGLGPFLWALGFAGILTAQYRRHRDLGWTILATVITSYIFWTLLPNRQIRFLLPGLSGLAIAAVSAWPNIVLWLLAAFQIFTAANLNAGWIHPVSIPLPFHAIPLFPSGRPSHENWHIKDILETAESKSDPSRPIADLVLIANTPFFNGSNFNWMERSLQLKHVHLRPVHKRLCEFSEFLLLKTGSLGPPNVDIGDLEKARKAVLDPNGWFQKAYDEVEIWPLPDQSEAILFQQKHLPLPPFRKHKISFQFYATSSFQANNLTLFFGAWNKDQSSYPLVDFKATDLTIQGLTIKNLHIQMQNLSLIKILDENKKWNGEVRFLNLSALKILSAQISADDLAKFLEMRAPDLSVEKVTIDHDLTIQALWRKIPVSMENSLDFLGKSDTQNFYLRASLRSLHIGPISIPTSFLKIWGHLKIPLNTNSDTPFNIIPSGLTLSNNQVSIP